MNTLEQRRKENIKRNAILLQELELEHKHVKQQLQPARRPAKKRRKLDIPPPTRSSARIASASARPDYIGDGDTVTNSAPSSSRAKSSSAKAVAGKPSRVASPAPESHTLYPDLESLRAGWTAWEPVAPPPSRDSLGTYHFASHPDFTPNKSPADIIREGSFGGSYWRPLYSQRLGTTVSDDWRELPADWTAGLDADQYLTNPEYSAEINKHGVACGQSIEAWEAAGWIAHEYDVRGWFQWYCRFWMGRRCADDERQISRWKKCVGETGRWRRTLLKQYVTRGIRSVFDDGDDGVEGSDVSPVVSQTCLHWAYEVRQEALDRYWVERR
ncbi:uncharacterized protein CC84DRAFT_1188329 [Paraphaeosphaeria sporulosa]|uniref:Uncharacterized protein n=1 Tax=Paraphaeosphaeria sporulosa TaxID=1460663 RepID=A0A177C855_9PLEO|nr:uncharacterized protein CC84DRAFT_1188329 [Paraphaeosphaeria sporulosa]OAG03735.1 hypothetical protein CC84DRAFT_1188329 [Paraphaeosphaeria sporulosa]